MSIPIVPDPSITAPPGAFSKEELAKAEREVLAEIEAEKAAAEAARTDADALEDTLETRRARPEEDTATFPMVVFALMALVFAAAASLGLGIVAILMLQA